MIMFFFIVLLSEVKLTAQTFIDVLKPNNYLIIGDLQWKFIIGILLSIASGFVIFGGLKSIVKVTSNLVPVMVALYFLWGSS